MFNHLNRIQTFISVVDCGSFTKAAERLFISKAMASIHVKSLEEVLYNDFREIFVNIETSLENISDSHRSLSGTLSITSTTEFGEYYLLPMISQFCQLNPNLNINYYADSSLNDLVTERLDLAIRLGSLSDSSLKSRKLASYPIVLVASACWLENNPLSSPEDLNTAPWVANSNLQAPTQWTLTDEKGQPFDVRAVARFHSNASTAIKSMACAGLGIAVLPEWLVRAEIASGKLVQLFPEYKLPEQDITIVYAGDHRVRLKCRKFIDYLIQNLEL